MPTSLYAVSGHMGIKSITKGWLGIVVNVALKIPRGMFFRGFCFLKASAKSICGQ